jgi:hypothetical protein
MKTQVRIGFLMAEREREREREERTAEREAQQTEERCAHLTEPANG